MTDYTELKRLAEALVAHDADSFYLPCTVAFERAATPSVVLDLIEENEKLKADLREAKDAKLGLSWALGEINGENEALRKDAERYRWLRTHDFDIGSFHDAHEHNHSAWFEHISSEDIDSSIKDENEFAKESGQ